MSIFWLEYLHFLTATFAIVVSVSTALLFLLSYLHEKNLRTAWRAIGFLALALAFLLFILERKYSFLEGPALIVQLFSFYSIYRGVSAEPELSHLEEIDKKDNERRK